MALSNQIGCGVSQELIFFPSISRCVVIGQVEDGASVSMSGNGGSDTNKYCLFLMMTDGSANLCTLKNIMALYFKWVLTCVGVNLQSMLVRVLVGRCMSVTECMLM